MKYVSNYYFLIHCKLFIILIGSNEANEKTTQAKKGLKGKKFEHFLSTIVKILDSRESCTK